MESITVQNYRCFREEQTAKLAPLTLLVGDNSTGKSSLMAMIRCLWDAAYGGETVPNFNQEPFDLGGYNDIVHYRGGRVPRPTEFKGKFIDSIGTGDQGSLEVKIAFAKKNDYPAVRSRQFLRNGYGIRFEPYDAPVLLIPPCQEYRCELPRWKQSVEGDGSMWGLMEKVMSFPDKEEIEKSVGLDECSAMQRTTLADTIEIFRGHIFRELDLKKRPRAIAPLRSQPQRTYDIGRAFFDAGGSNLPSQLMTLRSNYPEQWSQLKQYLEALGRELGLFSEIDVYPLRRGNGIGPFQLRVRGNPTQRRHVGPWRNLADVGYGVSQILPLLVALLEPRPSIHLLQQPEIHLHPRAQAALGTLMCNWLTLSRKRGNEHSLIIETHSNYLVDRIRMEVRDDKVDITPDEVSVVFFESRGLDVQIHNVSFDRLGNVEAPPAYASFFMEEVSRAIG